MQNLTPDDYAIIIQTAGNSLSFGNELKASALTNALVLCGYDRETIVWEVLDASKRPKR